MSYTTTIGRDLFWPAGCPRAPAGEDPDKFAKKWVKENPDAGFLKRSSRATYVGAGITLLGLLTGFTGRFKNNWLLKDIGWGLGFIGLITTIVGKMSGFEFDIPKAIQNTIVTGGTVRTKKTPVDFGVEANRVEEVDIKSHGEKLDGYLIKAKTETKKTVIYFHGIRNTIEDCFAEAKKLSDNLNVNVLIVDPRGFGNSKLGDAELTEKGLVDDAKEIYKFAKAKYGSENISVFGHSFGTAIATYLAKEKDIDVLNALILQSPFTKSEEALANGKLPKFITDFIARRSTVPFNLIDCINDVKAKNVVFIDAKQDSVIVNGQGKQLCDKRTVGNKEHIELDDANHSNYIDYYGAKDAKGVSVYDVVNGFIHPKTVEEPADSEAVVLDFPEPSRVAPRKKPKAGKVA